MRKAVLLSGVFSALFAAVVLCSCENLFLVEETGLYEVTFECNGGTGLSVCRTDCIKKMPVAEKEDASFLGWYTCADFSSEAVSFPFQVHSDVTLYAKWRTKYKVYFAVNGGTDLKSRKTDCIESSPDVTRSGYYLAGWYTSPDFGQEPVQFPYQLEQNTTLYARWILISNVAFITNGGSQIPQMSTAIISTSPQSSRTGYVLYGWYKEAELQNKVEFPYVVPGECILFAKWIPSEDTQYKVEHYKQTISLSTDTDTYMFSDYEYLKGTTMSKTQAKCRNYAGYTARQITQSSINADGSTVVKVYYDRNCCKVVLDSNGGSGSLVIQDFYYECPQNLLLNSYTKSGYAFKGWSSSKDGEAEHADGDSLTVNGDAVLFAVWQKEEEYYTYTVSEQSADSLDLSSIKNDCTITVTGKVTGSFLETLASQIKTSSGDVTLDFSQTENFTAIGCNSEKKSYFESCTRLKAVVFPSTMVNVGSYSFCGCTGLEEVSFPGNVKTIGSYAFNGCTGLTSIEIKGVDTIGSYAFNGCNSLISLTLEDVTTIGSHAFYACSLLNTLEMKNTGAIGIYAFSECTSLTYVKIDALTAGSSAFEKCSSLTSVVIGERVTELQNSSSSSVFYSCTSLSSVTFEKTIGWYARASSSTSASGGSVDVSVPSTNAVNLKYTSSIYFRK